ncbi:homeobox-leucine zipper protein HDG4 [Arabidopsis lyrata subsp. lyrata]|uniref:homeobox-leucine zipper protein HDG4 n=1 Tax=Arabidopsis lyrata subsp. lyrata TaxID=81972 RepID=UPI000A29C843|nr:homeobox-leucine zipper protein HDG4 [Arabidopsis lyrata subsp. lyrata]|eukprot:XP_020872468.1 homeobox-leucine zipper protein HDG4 [Arabidopsis lyrata subsp. lyrata]
METKVEKKMYGDYQEMKSGEEEEGHVFLNSDNIFGSVSSSPTTTIQNPNYKFTSFDNPNFPYIFPKEEYEMTSMIESGSGMSTWSGHDPVENTAIEKEPPPAKKKRNHRHTARQIQLMEALFKENPHLDDEKRLRLSKELDLSPLQVKFWFQNKRTQIKAQQTRRDNVMMKAENETLKTESQNLQSSLQCLSCSSCGHNLRLENARLRGELDRLRSIVSMRNPPPAQEIAGFIPETNNINNNMLIAEEEKTIAMELAVSCAQELAKMCGINEPLWSKKRLYNDSVCLNEEEYKKMFFWPPMTDDDRFRREASRANAVIMMNCINLVKAFLDADKWSEMFCPIVSSAKTIQIISSGASGPSGTLLLMFAELQVVSSLVPTREAYFLRYVEQNAEEGKWMIVDFPIDRIKPASATLTDQYRRKPSGCIIQAMRNGYSQVTWVEHVEVEEKLVQDEMVREYVKSGVAFGAERWLAVLKRQCERMASFMATNITDLGVIPSVEARKNLMNLSQRMVRTFCLNISNSYGQASTKDTVRIVTRKVCGGLVPCAVSVTLLPYSHHQVFDLLRDNQRLSQLEILFNRSSFQEVAHIANGSHPGNCISLLQINVENNSSQNVELMLQETCTDNSGSLLVYSTVEPDAVQLAMMNGEDPFKLPLLPVGFSVVPVNPSDGVEGISVNLPSCFLTVAIQVLGSNVTTAKLDLSTVSAINNRICATVNRITSALVNDVGN